MGCTWWRSLGDTRLLDQAACIQKHVSGALLYPLSTEHDVLPSYTHRSVRYNEALVRVPTPSTGGFPFASYRAANLSGSARADPRSFTERCILRLTSELQTEDKDGTDSG